MRKIRNKSKQFYCKLVGESLYDKSRLSFRIVRLLTHYPDFNSPVIKFQRSILSANDTILDIGSNRGFFTYHYSKIANKGIVYSFEPVKRTFKLQKRLLQS